MGSAARVPGLALGVVFWAFGSGGAEAHDGVHVSDAWARFLPGEAGGQVFLTIENHQTSDDRLVEAFSRMGEVEIRGADGAVGGPVLIPSGKTVRLEEGGSYLDFTNVTGSVWDGGTVPVTLVFELAGEVTLDVTVHNAR